MMNNQKKRLERERLMNRKSLVIGSFIISMNKNTNKICSDRILTCRIKSICSPAKGGTGCYRFNYQPGSSLEGV